LCEQFVDFFTAPPLQWAFPQKHCGISLPGSACLIGDQPRVSLRSSRGYFLSTPPAFAVSLVLTSKPRSAQAAAATAAFLAS
jgi:hypothetical protein